MIELRLMKCWLVTPAVMVAIGLETGVASAEPWNPDLGNGKFKNPVIFADYSDPDVVRSGDHFYLTASSFGSMPGLPILHSRTSSIGESSITRAAKIA